jgi:heat shock protein HslJ
MPRHPLRRTIRVAVAAALCLACLLSALTLGAAPGPAAFAAGIGTVISTAQVPPAPTPSSPSSAPAQIPDPVPVASSTTATSITQGVWGWQRTEMSDDTTIVPPDPNRYTISFQADGRLAIRADCNQGGGTYTLEGSQLTVKPGPMTLIACGPMSQDAAFMRGLRDVATYVMDGENLVLNLKVDSGNMVFSPQPPLSLTGGPWRVTFYNNGAGGAQSVLPDVELTATFGEDGNVNGNAGCNLYRGPYSVVGDRITFGNLISTRRACLSEPLNRQEQAFLTALTNAAKYELLGDRLTLRDDTGAIQAMMVRPSVQPVPSPATGAP